MIEVYRDLFIRELEKLSKEISTFDDESNLWIVKGTVSNSAGNLSLHLVGNLSTYIGQKIGGSAYVRDRTFEFAGKDVPRVELLQLIDGAKDMIHSSFEQMDQDTLDAKYPEEVLGYEMTTGYFIVHLISHLSYHLGQVNYLRRILEGEG